MNVAIVPARRCTPHATHVSHVQCMTIGRGVIHREMLTHASRRIPSRRLHRFTVYILVYIRTTRTDTTNRRVNCVLVNVPRERFTRARRGNKGIPCVKYKINIKISCKYFFFQ